MRPDISFTICALAKSLHAPKSRQLATVKRVLRYLLATRHLGIHFEKSSSLTTLKARSDSDLAGCNHTRQSTTGLVISINISPVSWNSVHPSVVALPSVEMDYIALSMTAKELTWIRRLRSKIKFQQPISSYAQIPRILIKRDNRAALAITNHEGINAWTKHIKMKFYHVRQQH